MAAVLSRNLSDIAKLSFYMDECKAMGISVKGPDINESYATFSVSGNDVIRFGLSAIKGVGNDVVRNIVETRENGGPFKDIYDFVERVPAGTLNRRVFDNLVIAGAFDCFEGIKREDLVAEVGKRGETVAEQLLRYGAQRQNEAKMQATSLFGFDDDIVAQSRPAIPGSPSWDNLTRLNKERELVGMYLSAHPLDPYWLDVNYGVPFTAVEKNEISQPTTAPVAFAGMVTGLEEKQTFNGGSMLIVKVEDYSGVTDFTMFEKQRAEFGHLCTPGSAIYVVGQFRAVRNKTTGVTNVRFGVDKIIPLDNLHGKLVTGMDISTTTGQLRQLDELLEEIAKSQNADAVPLNLTIFDPEIGRKLHFSTGLTIKPDKALLDTLQSLDFEFRLERKSLA